MSIEISMKICMEISFEIFGVFFSAVGCKAIETGMILFKDRVTADFFVITMKFHNIGLGYFCWTFRNFPTAGLLYEIRIQKI